MEIKPGQVYVTSLGSPFVVESIDRDWVYWHFLDGNTRQHQCAISVFLEDIYEEGTTLVEEKP